MIQLTYQAAFDPFHAVFRFLRLRETILGDAKLPRDQFRILDFYLLFPFRTSSIRVLQNHRRFKKIGRLYEHIRPYGDLPNDRILFGRMGTIQSAALDTLAKKNFLEADAYQSGLIVRTGIELPSELHTRIEHANKQEADLLEFLRHLATEYQLLGANGLKDRTGLMDPSYDAV